MRYQPEKHSPFSTTTTSTSTTRRKSKTSTSSSKSTLSKPLSLLKTATIFCFVTSDPLIQRAIQSHPNYYHNDNNNDDDEDDGDYEEEYNDDDDKDDDDDEYVDDDQYDDDEYDNDMNNKVPLFSDLFNHHHHQNDDEEEESTVRMTMMGGGDDAVIVCFPTIQCFMNRLLCWLPQQTLSSTSSYHHKEKYNITIFVEQGVVPVYGSSTPSPSQSSSTLRQQQQQQQRHQQHAQHVNHSQQQQQQQREQEHQQRNSNRTTTENNNNNSHYLLNPNPIGQSSIAGSSSSDSSGSITGSSTHHHHHHHHHSGESFTTTTALSSTATPAYMVGTPATHMINTMSVASYSSLLSTTMNSDHGSLSHHHQQQQQQQQQQHHTGSLPNSGHPLTVNANTGVASASAATSNRFAPHSFDVNSMGSLASSPPFMNHSYRDTLTSMMSTSFHNNNNNNNSGISGNMNQSSDGDDDHHHHMQNIHHNHRGLVPHHHHRRSRRNPPRMNTQLLVHIPCMNPDHKVFYRYYRNERLRTQKFKSKLLSLRNQSFPTPGIASNDSFNLGSNSVDYGTLDLQMNPPIPATQLSPSLSSKRLTQINSTESLRSVANTDSERSDHFDDEYDGDDDNEEDDEYDRCSKSNCSSHGSRLQPTVNSSILHSIRYYPVMRSQLIQAFSVSSTVDSRGSGGYTTYDASSSSRGVGASSHHHLTINNILLICTHVDQYKNNASQYRWWWYVNDAVKRNRFFHSSMQSSSSDELFSHDQAYNMNEDEAVQDVEDDDGGNDSDSKIRSSVPYDHRNSVASVGRYSGVGVAENEGIVRIDLYSKPFRIRSTLLVTGLELSYHHMYFVGRPMKIHPFYHHHCRSSNQSGLFVNQFENQAISPQSSKSQRLTSLMRWDIQSDVKITLENCKLENIHFVCSGFSQLRIIGCEVVNCTIFATQKSKLTLVNNRISLVPRSTLNQREEYYCIHVEQNCEAEIENNEFHFEDRRDDIRVTAIRLQISYQLGFGSHVKILNNLFVGCYQGIECIPDQLTMEERINAGQLEARWFRHSVQIRYNKFQRIQYCAIRVAALFLDAIIQKNDVLNPVTRDDPKYMGAGIILSDGSRCTVTHNHIIGIFSQLFADERSASTYTGILVQGKGTSGCLFFNQLSRCSNGLLCSQECSPEISDNRLFDNSNNIVIIEMARVHVHDNTISNAVDYGIVVRNCGHATISSNYFEDNSKSNIMIEHLGSSASISTNTIRQVHGIIGIHVHSYACCRIDQNKIYGDRASEAKAIGIYCSEYGQAYIYENLLTDCVRAIDIHIVGHVNSLGEMVPCVAKEQNFVDTKITALFEYTYLDDQLNELNQKYKGQRRCHVENNEIKENRRGIFVWNGGVSIVNNTLSDNKEGAFFARCEMTNSELLAHNEHKILLNNNRLFDNRYGISVMTPTNAELRVTLLGNSIRNNVEFGVMIFGSNNDSLQQVNPLISLIANQIIGTKQGPNLLIENACCEVLQRNLISGSALSGVMVRQGSYCILRDNIISHNSLYGIHISQLSSTIESEGNQIVGNNTNIFVDNSLDATSIVKLPNTLRTTIISENIISDALLDNIYIKFHSPLKRARKSTGLLAIINNHITNAQRFGVNIDPISDDINISSNTVKYNREAGINATFESRKHGLFITQNDIFGSAAFSLSPYSPLIENNITQNNIIPTDARRQFFGNINLRIEKRLVKANRIADHSSSEQNLFTSSSSTHSSH